MGELNPKEWPLTELHALLSKGRDPDDPYPTYGELAIALTDQLKREQQVAEEIRRRIRFWDRCATRVGQRFGMEAASAYKRAANNQRQLLALLGYGESAMVDTRAEATADAF